MTTDDKFKAVTWNVYSGTPTKTLAPILKAQRRRGVGLFLMQEAQGDDITKMLEDAGLRTFVRAQFRVAWDPAADMWPKVNQQKLVELSETKYYEKGGKVGYTSRGAKVNLEDAEGRGLMVVSYHTPAFVQVPKGDQTKNRVKVTMETFAKLGDMANRSRQDGVLFGGDDNVDEKRGIGADADYWAFMRKRVTGLRQLQAPEATHGKVRRIDDFRIKALDQGGRVKPVGKGWVADGGGDHKLHGRTFQWLPAPEPVTK